MKKARKVMAAVMAAMCLCSVTTPLCPAAAFDPCDVNHDGSVDITDVICINQHLCGARAYTNYNQIDANQSHTVDKTDAYCVLQKVIKGSYSACYIRQYPNGYMQVVNMPAVSSGDAVLDSAANDSSGRWYVGYSYLNNKPISRYQLTPNTMTLNSKSCSETKGLINGDDNRGVAHGYENTGIVGVNGATGFIVGDHQIATAAHVVDVSESPETNYIMTDISLMTYDRSGLPTGKKLTVAEVHMTETHAKSLSGEGAFSHAYDYALITVKEDLSDYVHFDIGNSYNMTNGEVGTIPIHVTGNPQFLGDDLNKENSGHLLYTHYGSVYGDNNTKELFYTVDTSGGQSGSPVYTITRETYNNTFYYTYTVLSLNSGGTTVRNRGPLMTKHHQMFYNNNSYAHYE